MSERKPDPRWVDIKKRMDGMREHEIVPSFEDYKEFLRMYLLERQTFDGRDGLDDLTNARFAFVSIMGEVAVRDERIDQQAAALEAAQRENARLRAALADIERHTRQETLPPSKAETVIKVANIVASKALQGGEAE